MICDVTMLWQCPVERGILYKTLKNFTTFSTLFMYMVL